MKFKHIWRHFKRWLFENESHKYSILSRRYRKLIFYSFRTKIKATCERTNLDESDYKWFYWTEVSGEDYGVWVPLLAYDRDQILPFADFMINKPKLACLYKLTGKAILGNTCISPNEMCELWYLWRDAPFWKDYAVWKKLHNMNEDF